ncbi:MAG: hypothetical protein EOP11_21435 [Proteobacteria bacterium]|nr:MAG: hypothetical protein EOP11_21435 [Pseudomonadota bacterium]
MSRVSFILIALACVIFPGRAFAVNTPIGVYGQNAQSCSLPWGGSVNHGVSATAYQSATVACGSSCPSQTRQCTQGTLLGTYAYGSCTAPCADCSLGGYTTAHGSSRTYYAAAAATSCSGISRTCNNGTLSGSASYTYGVCNQHCSVNGTQVNHGTTATFYYDTSASPCSSISQSRTCTNGSMSGSSSYIYSSCTSYSYYWSASGFGGCYGSNTSCYGGATQTQSVYCRRSDNGSIVSDSYCGGGKPATSQSCTVGTPCKFRVTSVDIGPCGGTAYTVGSDKNGQQCYSAYSNEDVYYQSTSGCGYDYRQAVNHQTCVLCASGNFVPDTFTSPNGSGVVISTTRCQ